MIYLLDTCVLSVLGRGGSPALDARLNAAPTDSICISSITVHEIHFGLEKQIESRPRSSPVMLRFLKLLPSIPFDDDAAKRSGQLRATLRQSGSPIGPYDVLIAGVALTRGLTLVTQNLKEFSRIPGLRVEDWTTTP